MAKVVVTHIARIEYEGVPGVRVDFMEADGQRPRVEPVVQDMEDPRQIAAHIIQATVIEPIISESEKTEIAEKVWAIEDRGLKVDAIKTKTDIIPSDLGNVPTGAELDAGHGSGSWEGATPTQVWSHPQRDLTTRALAGSPEEIASEDTLGDIEGTTFQTDTDSLKKIRETIDALSVPKATPKSVAQYLESLL